MQWKAKEPVYVPGGTRRTRSIFLFVPKAIEGQKRWLEFALYEQKYYAPELWQTTNIFGAPSTKLLHSFWSNQRWIYGRLSIKEKIRGVFRGLWESSIQALIVLFFAWLLYGVGDALYKTHESHVRLDAAYERIQDLDNTIKQE